MKTFISKNPTETMQHAARLAAKLQPGTVISLCGQLGSGKTCWVQGCANALGIEQPVSSPTFTIVNEYRNTELLLVHIDAYRLHGADEATAIGIDEYLNSEGITVIEWAERISELLPPDTISIHFKVLDKNTRQIEVQQL